MRQLKERLKCAYNFLLSACSDGQGSLACCSPWSCRVGHDWSDLAVAAAAAEATCTHK